MIVGENSRPFHLATYDTFRSNCTSNGRNDTLTTRAGPFVIAPLTSLISTLPQALVLARPGGCGRALLLKSKSILSLSPFNALSMMTSPENGWLTLVFATTSTSDCQECVRRRARRHQKARCRCGPHRPRADGRSAARSGVRAVWRPLMVVEN